MAIHQFARGGILILLLTFWGCTLNERHAEEEHREASAIVTQGLNRAETKLFASREKFESVYHSAKSFEGGLDVGLSKPAFEDALRRFATELAIVQDRTATAGDAEALGHLRNAYAIYKDSNAFWDAKIRTARYANHVDKVLGEIRETRRLGGRPDTKHEQELLKGAALAERGCIYIGYVNDTSVFDQQLMNEVYKLIELCKEYGIPMVEGHDTFISGDVMKVLWISAAKEVSKAGRLLH